jgi:endonuclease/exonuclease/phosphatase family metal-dependent hydrolase
MGFWAKLIAAGALAFGLYLGVFVVANSGVSARSEDLERVFTPHLTQAGPSLELITWNLGYGGLGAGSDFIADGGSRAFPPSRAAVKANVAGISDFLARQNADVVALEELAHAGPVNYWVNLKARVDAALSARDRLFFADFKTRLAPWPLAMSHGQGIYSRFAIESAHVVSLPAENSGILGVKRRYGATVARLAGPARWTVVVTHLAAFDADAGVRTRQLRELLGWADREYKTGRHVVIGGDFNLQLVDTHFPNTTERKYLFWIFPFPRDALAPGWRIAADPRAPSVRTNERPYRRGENYTTIIDGFLLSPNVTLEEVDCIDLDFQHSDHNPVRARLRAD